MNELNDDDIPAKVKVIFTEYLKPFTRIIYREKHFIPIHRYIIFGVCKLE